MRVKPKGHAYFINLNNEEDVMEDPEEAFGCLHDLYREEIAPHIPEGDIPAHNEAFNNWTDGLCKDGEICEWLYMNCTHPEEYA